MRSKLFLCVEFDPTATSVAAVCRSSSLTLISKQKQEHFYFHQLLVCVLIIRVTRARGSCINVSSEWEKPHSDFKSTFEKTFSVHESNLSIPVPSRNVSILLMEPASSRHTLRRSPESRRRCCLRLQRRTRFIWLEVGPCVLVQHPATVTGRTFVSDRGGK